ncbi:hypothetical protein Mapa_004194 [Marchantia paleacea]|nr:hypothetical protein Mapa_004194 [Marchantia paleacea]
MTEVWLHVYDVTNSMSVKANNAIIQLNKLMRDGIGVGGIFHGAIQVYDEEWSFGFCETGSGVFSCPPKENPMYTYRESVHLGTTNLSRSEVNVIIRTMIAEWPGCDYDLLSKNCNHFCEVFCAELHVDKLPLWVNRFAKTGDAAVEVAGNTMERLKQAKAEVVTAGKVAYRFLFGGPTSSTVSPDPGLPDSRQNGSNSSRRFSFSRTPSRLLGRTPVDSPVEERGVKENASKEEQDRKPPFSLLREASLSSLLRMGEPKR